MQEQLEQKGDDIPARNPPVYDDEAEHPCQAVLATLIAMKAPGQIEAESARSRWTTSEMKIVK